MSTHHDPSAMDAALDGIREELSHPAPVTTTRRDIGDMVTDVLRDRDTRHLEAVRAALGALQAARRSTRHESPSETIRHLERAEAALTRLDLDLTDPT